MAIQANTVGGPLDDIYKDLKLLPTEILKSYLQNPNNMQADGVSFSLMAGGVLADRARQQAAFAASQQPNPAQIPTVAQTLAQGQPVGVEGVPAGGAGITAFSTQAQQPQQQQQPQQITLNQPKQATPISLATPYAAAKTPLQQQVSAPPTPTRKMAQGGIVALSNGGTLESYIQRTNREAHERGVRESDPELAEIKDIDERNRRRLEKYGPPRDPILEGLSSMGAAAKDVLSYPVRATAAAAAKYLPIPDIPESFFGGDRSSMTPYMDKLQKQKMEQSEDTDAAILANRAKFAYGPSSGWSGVPSVIQPQQRDTTPSAQRISELEQSLIADGVTDPAERAAIIKQLTTTPNSTYRVGSSERAPSTSATSSPEGLALLASQASSRDYDKNFKEALDLIRTTPSFSAADAEKARKEAAERLQGAIDPRMAEIQKLYAAQSGIAGKGQENFMPLMVAGLGAQLAQMSAPKGTLAHGLGAIAESGIGSYRKNQQEQVARELDANKLQIKLQEQLMKQGVDQVTAGDVAEKEARKIVSDIAEDKSKTGSRLATALTQKEQAGTALERAQNQLTIAQNQLIAARERNESLAKIRELELIVKQAELALKTAAGSRAEIDQQRKNLQAREKAIREDLTYFYTPAGKAELTDVRAKLAVLGSDGGAAGDSSKGWEIKPKQ